MTELVFKCLVVCIWLIGVSTLEESTSCPGNTVNYGCTTGNANQKFISWLVSCSSSSESCGCDRVLLRSLVTNFNGTARNETPCDRDTAFLFTFNFIEGESNLSIAIPKNTNVTHLEIQCESICRCLHVRGLPSPPEHLTYHLDYNNSTDTSVIVTLMWSSSDGGLGGVSSSIEYTLLLTDSSHNSLATHTTHTTNWTTSLQFNETYLVTLYSSTCDNTLISDNFTTNITIQELQSNCTPPPDPPADVVMTPIVEGSVISYQCAEVETLVLCGDDGNWRPHPTTLTCSDTITSKSPSAMSDSASTPNDTITTSSGASAESNNILLPVTIGGSILGAILVISVVILIALILIQVTKKGPTGEQPVIITPSSMNFATAGGNDTIVEYSVLNHSKIKGTGQNLEYVLKDEDKTKNYSLATLPCDRVEEVNYDEIPSVIQATARVESSLYNEVKHQDTEDTCMVDTANVENGGCLYSEVKHLDTRDTSIVVTASVEDEGSLYSEVKHPDTRDKQIRSTSGGDTKCSEEIPDTGSDNEVRDSPPPPIPPQLF